MVLRLILPTNNLIGQYEARFRTEHDRQDLSTAYMVQSDQEDNISPNAEHFSGLRIVHNMNEVPQNAGAMYRYYLQHVLPPNSKI